MWQPWPEHEIRRVFTTESRQKDRRLFTQTHQPISRVMVTHNRLGFAEGAFVSEDDLLEVLNTSKPNESNRIFMIVGETGSGKSELCQWLEYALGTTRRPIHVSRSQASLNGLIDVLLSNVRGTTFEKRDMPPPDVIADHVYASLRLAAYRSRNAEWIANVSSLRPWVTTAVIQASTTGEIPQARDEPSLGQKCPNPDTLDAWLLASLRDALGMRALAPLLRALVAESAQANQRPVLLLEDITSIGFLRDELLDFVFDLSEPGFDVVLGLTSGFESVNLAPGRHLQDMAYVRDRVQARFLLSTTDGETFFLNSPESLRCIVQGYLSCLSPRDHHPKFAGVFPFTVTALERIYSHLIESGRRRQTPRNLLDAVMRPLLSQPDPPFKTLMRPSPYLHSPSVMFRQDGLSEDEIGLLYWYGSKSEGTYQVDEDISRQFGYRHAIRTEAFELPAASSLTLRTPNDSANRIAEWEEAHGQLRLWLAGIGPFGKRHYLKIGLQKLVFAVGDPRVVGHPHGACSIGGPLRYHRGGGRLPIHLADSGDAPAANGVPAICVPRNEPAPFYEELLNHAFGATESTLGFADMAGTLETISVFLDEFRAEIREYAHRALGMTVEAFGFGAWWYSQQLGHGFTEVELRDTRFLLDYRPVAVGYADVWDARANRVLARTHEEIIGRREAYLKLFMSLFHSRDGFVDNETVRGVHGSFCPGAWADQLRETDLRKARRAPLRQDGTGLTLYELTRPLVEYVRAEASYSQNLDGDVKALEEGLMALEYYVAVTAGSSSVAARLERNLSLVGAAGWLHIPIEEPPQLDHSQCKDMVRRGRRVLGSLSRDRRTASREARHCLATLRRLPIVKWDLHLRDLVHDLRNAVAARQVVQAREAAERTAIEERASASIARLLKAAR